MRSGTSLFNKTIFVKNLTRMWPVWALFSIGGLITAFASFTSTFMNTGDMYSISFLDSRGVYYNMVSAAIPMASLILSIVVFANVFSYMYTTRGAVFFHSLPVTRNTLFVSNFLSAYVMVVIPQLVGWFVFTILTITKGAFDGKGALICLYAILAVSLLLSSISLLCAQLTGRTSAMVLLNISANFFFAVAGAVIGCFYSGFLYGIKSESLPGFNYLSPVVAIISKISTSDKSDFVQVTVDGKTEEIYKILDVTIENLSLIGVYLIAAVIMILISYFLYKARSSESATEVVAFKGVRPILLYSYAFIASITGAIILYQMLDYSGRSIYNTVKIIFFIIFTTLIAYYVGRMIIERTVRVFTKKTTPGAVIFTALMIVLTIVLASDPTKKVLSVPDVEDIDFIMISTGSGEFLLEEGDEELMEYVIATQKKIAEIGEKYEPSYNDDNYYYSLTFYYNLKNGKVETREYSMSLYKQYENDPGSLENLLTEFVNTEPIVEKIYHLNSKKIESDYMSVMINTGNDSDGYYSDGIYGDDVEKFRAALLKDIRERKTPPIDIFSMGEYNERALAFIDYTDYIRDEIGNEYVRTGTGMLLSATSTYRQHYLWGHVDIMPEMTNTVNTLKELGYNFPER